MMASAQAALPYHSRQSSLSNGVLSGSLGGAPSLAGAALAASSATAAAAVGRLPRSAPPSIPPSAIPPSIPRSRSRSGSQMSSRSHPHPHPHPHPTGPTPSHDISDRTSDPSSKSGQTRSSAATGTSSQHSSLSDPRYNNNNNHNNIGVSRSGSHGHAHAHAHSHAHAHAYQAKHSTRRLRSQYPRSGTEKHVEYILVASFDIDRGPVMEYQYPVAITGNEHMLAELMLPDQAHLRKSDWTIFFLHKDTSQEEEEAEQLAKEERRRMRHRRQDRAKGVIHESDDEYEADQARNPDGDPSMDQDWSSSDSEPESGDGTPLIHVLNLVNTKTDKTAKRGAVVKAMAICTRHPFLHVYKPLLVLALDEYFKSPVPETLAMLYDAVNDMDLSLMPKLSLLERHLLQASDNKDLFVEKFERMIQMRIVEDQAQGLADESFDSAKEPPRPSEIMRTGTKAYIEGHHSLYSVPRDTHEFESRVLYKGIQIPIKVPVAIMPENVGDFSLIKLIQNFSDPHSKTPSNFPFHPHLTTNGPNTHPIIVLVNALLTQKRVIFLGHSMPSGDVAEAVLAACALASGGLLRDFTRHAFPYTDLTKIDDLLNVPGFIAGVTNPAFENHHEWWDLLCDLPSGKMKISSKIDAAPETEGLRYFRQQHPQVGALINLAWTGTGGPSSSSLGAAALVGGGGSSHGHDLTGDAAFMAEILRSIAERRGERVIRAKWRDWVVKFSRIAAAFEETVYGASALYIGGDEFDNSGGGSNPSIAGGGAGASGGNVVSGHGYVWADETAKARELAGNVARIEAWRNTRSYFKYIQDVAQNYTVRPLKGLDVHHMHDRLRTQRLTPAQSRDVYATLHRFVRSYDEVCLLLSVAPESHTGLFYIALGLLHKERDVRVRTAELLERIAAHEAGQHWWKALSRFEKLAYARVRRDADNDARARIEAGFVASPDVDSRVS